MMAVRGMEEKSVECLAISESRSLGGSYNRRIYLERQF